MLLSKDLSTVTWSCDMPVAWYIGLHSLPAHSWHWLYFPIKVQFSLTLSLSSHFTIVAIWKLPNLEWLSFKTYTQVILSQRARQISPWCLTGATYSSQFYVGGKKNGDSLILYICYPAWRPGIVILLWQSNFYYMTGYTVGKRW